VGIGRGHEARTRAALFVFRAKDASAIMVPMRQLTLRMDACVETLALLIAMAWADGKLEAREKEGVRGAASVLNLTKELRERLDTLLDKPVPLDQILVEQLSDKERAFAFVAAAWMSSIDDDVDDKESATLEKVGTLFGFSHDRQHELSQIAADLAGKRTEGGHWSTEIGALFKAIPPRLEEAPPASVETYDVVFT
jgi:tellurite resistance protein